MATPAAARGGLILGGDRRLQPLWRAAIFFIVTAFVLIPPGFFAWYERRRIDGYGLPVDAAFKSPTWEGFGVGVVQAAVVGIAMVALGGMQVHGVALAGAALASSGLAWLAACICVGISEEFLFRGYLLQTLWRGIGFWPASA